jgi:hypothetical protein
MKEMKVRKNGGWTSCINRTNKPPANALSGEGRGLRGRDGVGDLTNVKCNPIQNCHNESPCTVNIF